MIDEDVEVKARIKRAQELVREATDMDFGAASQMFLIAALLAKTEEVRKITRAELTRIGQANIAVDGNHEFESHLFKVAYDLIARALPTVTLACALVKKLEQRGEVL